MRSTPTQASILLFAALAVSACTSTQNVLEPAALVSQEAAPQVQFPLADQSASGTSTQMAAVQSNARVQFSPVIGATAEASTPLAARIAARASARGIVLVGTGDTSATLVMKGYFSAISENGETTVIYVWDVVDRAGNRIHRVQGQAKAAGAGGWPDVRPETMETIADQTVDQLASWLANGQV
jgi:L-asparaginase/Glu-tRNA(Gln) amidotransferase subunit D